MRRILAAILSSAIALEPMAAAAQSRPYVRFQPSDAGTGQGAPDQGGPGETTPVASGITGPTPLYAHAYSFVDVAYALSSGKAAAFSATGLPLGLAMAANGTLSGTPTAEAAGTATVTALAVDGTTQTLALPYEVHGLFQANYAPDAEGFVGQSGHVGVALSIPAPALTGGPVLPVTWALADGTFLPAGATLDADGSISGAPTAFGDYDFAVVATDASGATAVTQSFDASIADGIHVAALPDVSGHVGFPLVSETGAATGTILGPITWGVVTGAAPATPATLPAGMALDPSTGTISGTPRVAAASRSYRLSAVDSTGIPAYSPAFAATSYGALAIGTVAAMSMHVGQSFTSAAFVPQDAPVSPWTWRLTPGATLPSALGVDANAGDVYGTGGAVGSSTATVDMVDAQGDAATSNPFAVDVVAPLALAAVADQSAPSGGTVAVAPALTGTPVGSLHWSLTGHGYGITASQDPVTGALGFTSTLGSTGRYVVTASDDSGTYGDAAHASAAQSFTVSFAAPFTASGPSGGTFRVGDAVSLAAPTTAANPNAPNGGAAPASVTWKVVDGTLPDGLAIAPATGVVSGTLKADAQSATVTLLATDPSGVQVAASPQLSLTILAPLAFVPPTVSAHVGQPLVAAATTPTVTGGAAIGTLTWSLLSGTLPAGMSVDPNTGAIVGTPTTTAGQSGDADPDGLARAFGRFAALLSPVTPAHAQATGAQTTTVTVQAQDSKGAAGTNTVTRTVTVVVAPSLSVAATADVSKRVGDVLSIAPPAVANAVGSKVWSLAKSSAAPPSWMTIDQNTGAMYTQTYAGIAPGIYSGTIVRHVVDAAGGAGVDAPAFNLTVKAALGVTGMGSTVQAPFGTPFQSVTPRVQGDYVAPLTWSADIEYPNGAKQALPSWIVVDPVSGLLSGTYPGSAAQATNGSVTPVTSLYLKAVDGAGEPASVPYPGLSVVAGVGIGLTSSPTVPLSGYARPGSIVDVAGPGVVPGQATPVPPYSFAMGSGNLPTGLKVSKGTGEISGQVTAADNSTSGSLQVVDSAGHFGVGNVFNIDVLPPLQVDVPSPALTTYVGGPIATTAPQVTSNHPVAPVVWSLSGNNPIPGTTFKADGTFTGTASSSSPPGTPFTATLLGADSSTGKDPVVGGATVSVAVQPAMTLPAQTPLSFRVNLKQALPFVPAASPLGTVTYAIKGAMPGGPGALALDGQGDVAGMPTAAGAATTVTLVATDSASTVTPGASNQAASAPLAVTVLPALTLATMSDLTAHVGSTLAIAAPAVSNSPTQPLTWSLSGTLPSPAWINAMTGNVRVTNAGVLVGLIAPGTIETVKANADGSVSPAVLDPTSAGDYPVTLQVTDATGAVATNPQSFVIHVRSPLTIDPVSPIAALTMNVANAIAPPAVHGNPGSPSWTLLSGTLPRGMSVRAADGYLVGPALQSGTFTAVIGFTDSSGASLSTPAFSFAVTPLSIAPIAEVDVTMNSGTPVPAPTLNGSPLPTVAWTVTAGTPPRGMKANADGTITGAATQSGTFPLTLLATDANGETASVSFPLKVQALSIAQVDQTAPLNVKLAIAAPVVANGAKAPLAWTETGALPAGVTSTAGAISGTPTAPGTYPITLSVKDADGETATTAPFNLVVPTPALAVAADPTTVVLNTATTVPAPAIAPGVGAPTIAWKLAGALPKGTMTFSTTAGTIAGKATSTGTFPLTVSATDGNGVALTPTTFHLVVPAPVVAPVPDLALQMNTAPAFPAPTVTGDPNVTLAWSLALGPMPAGLSVNPDGTLGGQATAPGTFPVQLSFVDPNGVAGQTNVFSVVVPALALAANVAEQDLALNTAVTIPAPSVSGTPTAAQAWTVASGTLPSGLALAPSTGVVSGSPKRSGTFPVSLKLVDGNGQSVATNVFKIVVAPLTIASAPTVQVARAGLATPPSALTLHQGDAGYAFPVPAVTGTPGGAVTWSATAGALPPGLSFNAASNTIGGTPTSSGVYALALLATDANGETAASPPFTLTVLPPLVFGSVSSVTLSTAYSRSVAAPSIAGSPQQPYLWQVASGTLPAKTALAPASGAISGQPDSTGAYPLTLSLTDATGDVVTTPSFTLNVNGVLTATNPATTSVHANAPSGLVTGTAILPRFGVPPYAYKLASGTPPNGLSVDPATGLLSGTTPVQATYPAAYRFSETVTDADGKTFTPTSTYEVDVTAPLAVTTPANASIHAGAVADAAPTVTNGTGAIAWAIVAPTSVPAGMAVSSTGVVSTAAATPPGTYAVTLTATDATGAYATTGSFNVNVYGALALAGPTSKLLLRYGVAYAGTQAGTWTPSNAIGTPTIAQAAVAGLAFSGSTLAGTPTGTTSAAAQPMLATLTDAPVPSTASSATATATYDYYGTALGITAADGGAYATGVPVSIPAPTVTGTPVNPRFTLSAALPAGLTLNADGSITGTATQAATVVEVLTVSDDTGGTAPSASFTLVTQSATTADQAYPSSIANSSGTNPSVAAMYDQSQATGTTVPAGGTLTYAFAGPVTANGMSSSAATSATANLVLSYNAGTPSAPVWTKVAGAANPTATLFQVANTGATAITLPDLFLGYGGKIEAFLPSTTAGSAPSIYGQGGPIALDTAMATINASGAETWTALSGNTGNFTFSGSTMTVPSTVASGTYTLSLSVTDSRGYASDPHNLVVGVGTPPSLTAATASGTQYVALSVDLTSIMSPKNTSSPVYTVSPGSTLPAGLTLSTAGLVSGIPTVNGTVTTSITVTNAGGLAGTGNVTLDLAIPALASAVYPTGIMGSGSSTPVPALYDGSTTTVASLASTGSLVYTFAGYTQVDAASLDTDAATTNLTVYYNTGTAASPVWTAVAGASNPTSTMFKVANSVTSLNPSRMRLGYGGAYPASLPSISTASVGVNYGTAATYNLDTTMSSRNVNGTETWTASGQPSGATVSTTGTLTVAATTAVGIYNITLTMKDSRGVASVPVVLTLQVYAGLASANYPNGLTRETYNTSTGAYGAATDSVAALYDGSSATTLAGAITGTGTIYTGLPNRGLILTYVQPVQSDGSVDDASGTSWNVYVNTSTTGTANMVLVGPGSAVQSASTFYLVPTAGIAQASATRVRLGYGNAYPAALPSITAGRVTPSYGTAATYNLDTVMATASASGTETWAASGLGTGMSISGSTLTVGANASVGDTAVTLTVTDSKGVASVAAVLTVSIQATVTAATQYPNGLTRETYNSMTGIYGSATDSVPALYDGSSATTLASAITGITTIYTGIPNRGLVLTYAQPVQSDGSVDDASGSSWNVYVNANPTGNANMVLVGPGSSVRSASTFYLVPTAGIAQASATRVRLGYGNAYPATLPSITAARIIPTYGTAAPYNLDTVMATASASGTETWAASGLGTGMSISGSTLTVGANASVGDTPVTLTVTDSKGVASVAAVLTVSVQATATAASQYPNGLTRETYNSSTGIYGTVTDSVPAIYDGSNATTLAGSILGWTPIFTSIPNHGITLTYAQPVQSDGSVDDASGNAWNVYVNANPTGNANMVLVGTGSAVRTASTFYLVPTATVAQANATRVRLGYGNAYPATLPSITAARIIPTYGTAAPYYLDTTMATTNAAGTETWAASGLGTGMSISGSTLTVGANASVGDTSVTLTVTDSKGVASVAAVLSVSVQATVTAATLIPSTITNTGHSASAETVSNLYDSSSTTTTAATVAGTTAIYSSSTPTYGLLYSFSQPVQSDGSVDDASGNTWNVYVNASTTGGTSMVLVGSGAAVRSASQFWLVPTSTITVANASRIRLGYGSAYPTSH